jgi:hypothetical protein
MQAVHKTLAALQQTGVTLTGDGLPLIVYCHARWHLVCTGYVAGPKMGSSIGITTVNFISGARAASTVAEWLPHSHIIPFNKITRDFGEELWYKVLPAADDYRPLIRNGWVDVVGGYATENTKPALNDKTSEDNLVATILRMIQTAESGPFLHFNRSYRVIQLGIAKAEKYS